MKKLIVALSVLAVACGSQADLLAYEGFDYAANTNAGEIQGLNGGTGFSSGWEDSQDAGGSQEFRVVSPGDSWGSLPVTNNRISRESAGGKEYLARTLSDDLDAGSELWFSMLWSRSSNEGIAIAGSALGEAGGPPRNTVDGNCGFGIQNTDDTTVQATIFDDSGSRTIGGSNTLGTATALIAAKISFGATSGDKDSIDLYLPDSNMVMGESVASQSLAVDESQLDTFTMETNRGPGYDEIRVGTSYTDVIPEPATIGMIGLMGVGALSLRRRRFRG